MFCSDMVTHLTLTDNTLYQCASDFNCCYFVYKYEWDINQYVNLRWTSLWVRRYNGSLIFNVDVDVDPLKLSN